MKNMMKDNGLSKLKNWIDNSFSMPNMLCLLITNNCNASCLFCEGAKGRNQKNVDYSNELLDKEWIDIVNQGIKMGVADWDIPGNGEPLSRSKLILKLFKAIKNESSDSFCKITTNGSLFTEYIIKEFVKIGVDRISFSLDSPNEETHDFLRRKKGIFKNVIHALERFNHWKSIFKSDKPKINFNTVLTSKNYNQLTELVDLASKFKVEFISLNPLRVSKYNLDEVMHSNLRLNSKQKEDTIKKIQLIKKNVPLRLNGFEQLEMGAIVSKSAEGFDNNPSESSNFKNSFLNSPCFEPWLTMSINYKGDVGYCTSCGEWEKAENIKDKSLEDIWRGGSFKYVRSCMLQHKPLESCFGCGIKIVRKNVKRELDEHFKNVQS